MKNFYLLAIFLLTFSTALAEAETIPQYAEGQAQATDNRNHGEFMGDSNQHEVGGFGKGFADFNYQASDPIQANGWGTAEVIIDGYSFFYDPQVDSMTGGESYTSVTSSSLGATNGTWGKSTFNQDSEQSSWISVSGDLEFGYGYNQTAIQDSNASIENNGPLSVENKSTAKGSTAVQIWSGDGTQHTKVDTYGSAFNTSPEPQSGFSGSGGYGGGNTLINGNAVVQGQFSGKMDTTNPTHSFVSGSGQVNLTNQYQEGLGNVVRAEVNSTSSIGGGQ